MTTIALEVLLILALVLANGVFALSEIAIVSARKSRLQTRARSGNRRARVALELAENPGDFLSTVQIGITLVGILTGVFGGATIAEQIAMRLDRVAWIAPHGETVGVVIVVLVITFVTVILGELVPKRIALANAETVAGIIAPMMSAISRFSRPAVWLLTKSSDVLFKLLRLPQSRDETVTAEELTAMIKAGISQGEFHPAEERMVRGVFTLGERRADTVLRSRREVVWLDVNGSSESIQQRIVATRYSRYPVVDGSLDKLLGVVDIKDMLPALFAGKPIDLRAIMKAPLLVREQTGALEVLRLMRLNDRQDAIVLDEIGSIEGMISRSDLAGTILGDDIDSESMTIREDGTLLVDGMMKFDAFSRHVNLSGIESDEHTIVAQFALSKLGRIPREGDTFEVDQWRFEIVDMDGRRIDKILVSPLIVK
ncbi:MAG TPA: hemolysin family protein [Thermoanaerobaculia bacterium]|nr:hemolysin family protein [Thermoanaerobaculia bacterium]